MELAAYFVKNVVFTKELPFNVFKVVAIMLFGLELRFEGRDFRFCMFEVRFNREEFIGELGGCFFQVELVLLDCSD